MRALEKIKIREGIINVTKHKLTLVHKSKYAWVCVRASTYMRVFVQTVAQIKTELYIQNVMKRGTIPTMKTNEDKTKHHYLQGYQHLVTAIPVLLNIIPFHQHYIIPCTVIILITIITTIRIIITNTVHTQRAESTPLHPPWPPPRLQAQPLLIRASQSHSHPNATFLPLATSYEPPFHFALVWVMHQKTSLQNVLLFFKKEDMRRVCKCGIYYYYYFFCLTCPVFLPWGLWLINKRHATNTIIYNLVLYVRGLCLQTWSIYEKKYGWRGRG